MQSKSLFIISGVLIVVIIAFVAFFTIFHTGAPTQQKAAVVPLQAQNNSPGTSSNNNVSQEQANQASPNTEGQQAVTPTPINTNVGSVAGVDLSGLASEANQSASLSSQDGSDDAKTISSDGQTINSSIDSVNNPIQ